MHFLWLESLELLFFASFDHVETKVEHLDLREGGEHLKGCLFGDAVGH